jgi:hypothetical protein
LIVNLDEILNDFLSLTNSPMRSETPALSDADPGIEAEVHVDDLSRVDIQGINWGVTGISREDFRASRYEI